MSDPAASIAEDAVRECPPFFEWVNTSASTGYCACVAKTPIVYCAEREQKSYLLQGACTYYDVKSDKIWGSWCPFLFPDDVLQDGLFPLPANISELNTAVCGNLTRELKGPVCGRCSGNTGPSVYYVGIRCVQCSPINILYYILLQYGPSTLLFVLVIIFRPNITSAPMLNYVLYCNFTVFIPKFYAWINNPPQGFITVLAKCALTLSAVWSFDALPFISHALCISKHMEEINILYLEFIATIYPFILLLLTYALMKLHSKNCRLIVTLWRMLSRLFVQFYRAWDPTSSTIQAFASLFFLSYAKLSYLIWGAFAWNNNLTTSGHRQIFYIDPNVPYHSTKHVILMMFAVAVTLFLLLPPLLILLVYPTLFYTKFSDRISLVWRIRIKTYVEMFQGSFKDGTNGSPDYRSLSTWLLFLFGFTPLIVLTIVLVIVQNNFDTSLLRLLLALGGAIYNRPETQSLRTVANAILLVPHIVFWGYIVWRVISTRAANFCKILSVKGTHCSRDHGHL